MIPKSDSSKLASRNGEPDRQHRDGPKDGATLTSKSFSDRMSFMGQQNRRFQASIPAGLGRLHLCHAPPAFTKLLGVLKFCCLVRKTKGSYETYIASCVQ